MAKRLSRADLLYIDHNFIPLAVACEGRNEDIDHVRNLIARGRLPQPSYVLDDGTEIVPPDYFRLLDDAGSLDRLKEIFFARYDDAGGAAAEREGSWEGYMRGVYGVCLREVTPEAIARKNRLVDEVEELLARPEPREEDWLRALAVRVDELDCLERDFSPDYDRRGRFPQPPTRDRLIRFARERYPHAFAVATEGRR
jgi:hypothetical protein